MVSFYPVVPVSMSVCTQLRPAILRVHCSWLLLLPPLSNGKKERPTLGAWIILEHSLFREGVPTILTFAAQRKGGTAQYLGSLCGEASQKVLESRQSTSVCLFGMH